MSVSAPDTDTERTRALRERCAGCGERSGEEANIAEDEPNRVLRTGWLHSLPSVRCPSSMLVAGLRRQASPKWVPAARSSVRGWQH
ncbi:MAG: hypothetical protein ACRDTD_02235 [Pseudonocardiaceae bacterium]